MIRAVAILVAGLVIGCKGTAPADPTDDVPASIVPADPPDDACCTVDPADPVPPPVLVPAVAPSDEAVTTPASLYAQCRERVELPEAAGECKTSADCGVSGCGGEMCVAKSHGAIMSTCEVRACFSVLDACGCVDGRCAWSLKAAVPEGRRMIPLE